MYRVKLGALDDKQYKSLCRRIMIDKDMQMKDLAEKTGYSVNTLYRYFCKTTGSSKFVAAKIGEVLGITKE